MKKLIKSICIFFTIITATQLLTLPAYSLAPRSQTASKNLTVIEIAQEIDFHTFPLEAKELLLFSKNREIQLPSTIPDIEQIKERGSIFEMLDFKVKIDDHPMTLVTEFYNEFSFMIASVITESLEYNEPNFIKTSYLTSSVLSYVIFEMFRNAFIHGNAFDVSKPVYFNWKIENKKLTMVFGDNGKKIKWNKIGTTNDPEYDFYKKYLAIAKEIGLTGSNSGHNIIEDSYMFEIKNRPYNDILGINHIWEISINFDDIKNFPLKAKKAKKNFDLSA